MSRAHRLAWCLPSIQLKGLRQRVPVLVCMGVVLATACSSGTPAAPAPATSAPPQAPLSPSGSSPAPSPASSASVVPPSAAVSPVPSPSAGFAPAAAGTTLAIAAAVPPVPGSSPTNVTVCIPSRSDTILPVFAAQDAGFLQEENINADLPYFAGGQVDTALAAGQCDFVFGAGGIGPLLQGQDVVAIGATTPRPLGEIWGQPSLATIQDLKGKSIATSGAGSLSWRLARYYLEINNLTPDQDVAVLGTGDSASTMAAVTAQGGTIPAALLNPPDTLQAGKQGLVQVYRPPTTIHMLNTGLATTQRYLTAHRDVATALLKGICDAINRLVTDKAFYGQELNKFLGLSLDDTTLGEYWTNAQTEYTLPPRMDHGGAVTTLQLYSDQASDQDLEAVANRWLDMSLVDQLFP